jgi:hypothetical protein
MFLRAGHICEDYIHTYWAHRSKSQSSYKDPWIFWMPVHMHLHNS